MAAIGVTDYKLVNAPGPLVDQIDGYTSFSSADLKTGNPLVLYISDDQVNPESRCYAASTIYISDRDPDINIDTIYESLAFKISLGGIIYKDRRDDAAYLNEMMTQHLESISGHINTMTRNAFVSQSKTEQGVLKDFKDIKTFTDLLGLLIKNADEIITGSRGGINDMYRKSLDVKYSIYFSFIRQVNSFAFALLAKKKKKKGEDLTEGELLSLMNSHFRTGEIYTMIKESPSVSSHQTTTDNYYLGGAAKATHNTKVSSPYDSELVLDASSIELGTISGPSKSCLRTSGFLNCFVQLDDSNSVIRNPKTRAAIAQVQRMIER